MCNPDLGYLPIALVILSAATFFTTYVIAVANEDVEAYFPYISDTGTHVPESCIFGQFLNISAFLSMCTMFVRYKLVKAMTHHTRKVYSRLNKTSLVCGVFTSIGLSIVANFQETNIEPVHITGAALVFGFGVIYAILQTILSYKMHPNYNGLYVCRARLAITLVSIISMIITFAAAVVSRWQWNEFVPMHARIHWESTDNGFTAHIISTMGEWIMAITFLLFFFTYIRDFQKISLGVHTHVHVCHLDDIPQSINGVNAGETTRLIT